MEELIVNLLYDLIYLLAAAAAAFFVALLKKKIGTEKLQQIESELATKQELAILAVRFVEQVWTDIEGVDKYNQAARWMADRVKELGLSVTDKEIKGLIEAALRSLKDEFGEEWAKATED